MSCIGVLCIIGETRDVVHISPAAVAVLLALRYHELKYLQQFLMVVHTKMIAMMEKLLKKQRKSVNGKNAKGRKNEARCRNLLG